MSTRRPPVAPKAGPQLIGPLEGQQILLESHTPSPRKGSLSDYGSLGSLRPRSPRPVDVHNAAAAEVAEVDYRVYAKAKVVGSSPASSPGRRRGGASVASLSVALNPLSPRHTTTSILDHTGYKPTMTLGGVGGVGLGGSSPIIAAASTRVLSALEEHRQLQMSSGSGPQDRLYSTAPLPGTPQRKATSAPDSQSAQALMRTSASPWSKESLAPLQPSPPPSAAPSSLSAAAMGHYVSPIRHRGGVAPPSPPLVQNLAFPSTSPHPPPLGYGGHAPVVTSTAAPLPSVVAAAAAAGGGGPAGLRRDSLSSCDSHSPGVVYESPSGTITTNTAFSPALRVAILGRIGSPNSPSTPSSSQPHTPVSSSLKPKPPPTDPAAAANGRSGAGSGRKVALLSSPEAGARRPAPATHHQQQHLQQHLQQQQQQLVALQQLHLQQAEASSPGGDERQLVHMTTAPEAVSGDELPPPHQVFHRSLSMGAGGSVPGSTHGSVPGSSAFLPGLAGFRDGSQPGTPTSASRPNSGRAAGGGYGTRQPVVLLYDAVRSKDEGKLAEVLEALKGPQGQVLGLNDRNPATGRTPLHEAAITNSTGMVALLLAAGADPNIGHETQGPPLLHSAAYGEVEIMRLLLDEGADVNAVDVQRDTALHLACAGNHVDAARLLTRYGAVWTVMNGDHYSPVQLAPPEFMRLYTYEPPRSAPAAAGGAGGGVGLYSDASYSGVDVALSPERPSSTSSSRPTSATTPASRIASALEGGIGGLRRMAGRPPSGAAAAAAAAAASTAASPSCGPPLSPTSQIDLCGGSSGGSGVVSQPTSAGGGAAANLRPVPPPDPAGGGGGGFRSRRNSASSMCAVGGAAAPGGGVAPTFHPGSGAVAAAAAAAAAGNRAGAPASPLLPDSESVPSSPPTLQLPGGVRRQLSRGAGEGDILSAFQAEDAEIVRNHGSGVAASAGPGAGAGLGGGAGSGTYTYVFPPFHPPPGLPTGPSAAATKPKSVGHCQGDKEQGHLAAAAPPPPPPPAGPFSVCSTPPQPSSPSPQGTASAPLPQLRIKVPETSVIRFGVRLQVHGSPAISPDSGDGCGGGFDAASCDTPNASSGAAPSSTAASSSVCASGSGGGAAAAGFSPLSSSTSTSSTASTATSGGGSGGGPAAAAATPAAPTRQCSVGFTMPSFSAGVAPAAVVADGSAAVRGDDAAAAVGFTPVPTTGFTPVPTTGFTPPPAPAPAAAAPVAAKGWSRASGSGDEGVTPPLVRDSSPVRDPRSSGDGGGGGNGAGGPGGGGGGVRASERSNPQRASILAAAKALKRITPVNASKDAIEVRAANMFRQSTDLRTGELEWTQGELLGEGAFGKVYAGLNQQTGELMAVKVMQLISHQMNKEAALKQLLELEHEMKLYKKLRNKHVVGFIDARYDPDTAAYYIFLEYVPGGSISSMLQRFKRFSEELVRNYTRQLLQGLEYLHKCRVVHRDLKGGNVLVSRDGVVKLTDFGASKAYRDQTIKECMMSVRGSVYWMAPEVIRGTGYDRRADIWSLGCTVIEMLSGTHPWPNLDNQWTAMFTIAKTEEGPPRPLNMSQEAARFLDRCLQFDPAKRPTATELLQDPFVSQATSPGPCAANSEGEARLQHSF